MKISSLVLIVAFSFIAEAAENAFIPFKGEYEVLSSDCKLNMQPSKEHCELSAVKIVERETGLELREFGPDNGYVGYPLSEKQINETYASESAKVEGDGISATWTYKLQLSNDRRVFEVRSLVRKGESSYRYIFVHKENPLTGKDWMVTRHYNLKRLD